MPKYIDITGQKFGFLTVESYIPEKKGAAYFNCKCKCGNSAVVRGSDLRSGSTKSCGCLKKICNSNKLKNINREKRKNLRVGEFTYY